MEQVIELYVCSMCGITNETCKHWGPTCKKTGRRVCSACCYKCEYRVSWSGIWRCRYMTPEDRKAEARQRARARFDSEAARISQIHKENMKRRAGSRTRRK